MSVLYSPVITETQRQAHKRHRSFGALAVPTAPLRLEAPRNDAFEALIAIAHAEAEAVIAPADDWVARQKQIHGLPLDKTPWFSIDGDVTADAPKPRIEDIQRLVSSNYNVSRADLLSARRTARVVHPRQVAMYLAKTLTLRSLPEIGRRFGGRDHTTVLHAVRKIEALVGKDSALDARLDYLKNQLLEGELMGANNVGIGWTAERDEALRAAWAAGVTAKQFAIDLGGFDHTKDGGKNSVISRVHTLGLPKRREGTPRVSTEAREGRRLANVAVQNAKRSAHGAARPFDQTKFKAKAEAAGSRPVAPAYQPTGLSFGELRDLKNSEPNQCRYIDKDDHGPNFLYCGSETLPGESLCGHCQTIAYSKPQQISEAERARRGTQQAKNLAVQVLGRPQNSLDEVHA